ncbi:MAG: hypothetical protein ACI8XC_004422 [Gammaproteobacteria bacterium]|jgi:hypothetical protein
MMLVKVLAVLVSHQAAAVAAIKGRFSNRLLGADPL